MGKGRVALFIDGIDEISPSARESLLKELSELVQLYPLLRLVITSRPTAVDNRSWPEWNVWLLKEGFLKASINEYTKEQINSFIHSWHKTLANSVSNKENNDKLLSNADSLISILNERSDLSRLATNPLLCSMISAIFYVKDGELPENRIELYQNCIEVLLESRDNKREIDLSHFKLFKSINNKILLVQYLSYWMMDNGKVDLTKEEIIQCFLHRLPISGISNDEINNIFDYFIERSGLLTEYMTNRYIFIHLTFQEYFAALEGLYAYNIGSLAQKVMFDHWHEVIKLTIGVARPHERKELVTKIIDVGMMSPSKETKMIISNVLEQSLEICLDKNERLIRDVEYYKNSF